jgi:EAL domain-containing protein (putative c-di-GMP-specific phosphodiesterase class I)/GGDEF domain-containing protein
MWVFGRYAYRRLGCKKAPAKVAPAMPEDLLKRLLPELVVLIRRDGVVLDYLGGHGVPAVIPPADCVGKPLESVWPEQLAGLVKPLVRRTILDRSMTEVAFHQGPVAYVVAVDAQGPERAVCVVRRAPGRDRAPAAGEDEQTQHQRLDRRGFLRRLRHTMASAALREKPTAIALIQLDGVADLARVLDSMIAEQAIGAALRRLSSTASEAEGPRWYIGQLGEDTLALVLDSADRETIEACVTRVCEDLRAPVRLGNAAFHLTPYAGVAILGQDGTSPKVLLDQARAAAAEARRSGASSVRFFTDTLRLRSLARLDIARELNEAIERQDICLRYVGRHDLASGSRTTQVGYLRWRHPLRGEVKAAEFVAVAEATGLAMSLSRAALQCLADDFASAHRQGATVARISFGALRHHVLHREFVADISRFLAQGSIPAELLELRIAERTFIALDTATVHALNNKGVQLVVDEVGRGLSSLDRLARSPLWGLQLDRSWTSALSRDPGALKVCGAGVSMAIALGLTPIATGVDSLQQHAALLGLGCRQGMGDLYGEAGGVSSQPKSVFCKVGA